MDDINENNYFFTCKTQGKPSALDFIQQSRIKAVFNYLTSIKLLKIKLM